jgi:hypothetical protein
MTSSPGLAVHFVHKFLVSSNALGQPLESFPRAVCLARRVNRRGGILEPLLRFGKLAKHTRERQKGRLFFVADARLERLKAKLQFVVNRQSNLSLVCVEAAKVEGLVAPTNSPVQALVAGGEPAPLAVAA